MVWLDGGRFLMGSDAFYPEERPVHQVEVDGFWIDRHPVTNAQFRRFVKATGYVTLAEQPPEPADYPDADPALLVPGALVFQPSAGPVDLRDWRAWWAWVPGSQLAEPGGARVDPARPRPPSRRPGLLPGRPGVRRLGRQGAAQRGRVGVRRQGRPGGQGVRLG